jgi:hypothetical protein
MRLLRLFTFLFVGLCSIIRAEESRAYPKEAWVLFANEGYFGLMEITIAGLHEFSDRPIVAVGVNADVPFSLEKYPRLFKKRIDVDLNERRVYYYKPQAILAADLDYGVYLDVDALPNKGCDGLFEEARRVGDYPLLPRHEDEAYVLEEAMDFFGVKRRSMHYVHSDVVVYSKKCLPFMMEWSEICLRYPRLGYPVWDETLINVLLWQKGATEQLYICDPYNAYFGTYLGLSQDEIKQHPYHKWYVFHGNKDIERGWRMLEALKLKHKV